MLTSLDIIQSPLFLFEGGGKGMNALVVGDLECTLFKKVTMVKIVNHANPSSHKHTSNYHIYVWMVLVP